MLESRTFHKSSELILKWSAGLEHLGKFRFWWTGIGIPLKILACLKLVCFFDFSLYKYAVFKYYQYISRLRFKQGRLNFQGLNIPTIATNSNLIPCVLFVRFSALWCTLSLVHTQGRLKQFWRVVKQSHFPCHTFCLHIF